MAGPEQRSKKMEALTTHTRQENTNISSRFALSELTLQKVRTVNNHALTNVKLTSCDQIPDYILNKLMIVDYHAREFKLKPSILDKTKSNYDSNDSEDEDNSQDNKCEDTLGVNPMDELLRIFHRSDFSLRKFLAIKLSACQLSVPFLLPDPEAPSENGTILLSALENITKSWYGASGDGNESTQEVFATEHPFPVVSFIRIGIPNMSKSFLMNKVMSDRNSYHDFFFYKDMKGGNVRRKIVDGLVELSWYLPGGSEKQTLQNEICFVNLRGDGRDFKKQLNVLLKISSVLCILLSSECPDIVTDILERATNTEAKVILILNETAQPNAKDYFDALESKHSETLYLIRNNKSNEYNFLDDIRAKIQTAIKKVTKKPLVHIASCASEHGIQLDDDPSNLRLGTSVDSWLEIGIKEAKNIMKLQMHIPALAELEREKYRQQRQAKMSNTDPIKRDVIEADEAIKKEKEAQKGSLMQLDARVLHCLNSIAMMDKTERNYVLNKLKHQLDKMSLQFMMKLRSGTQTCEDEHIQQLEDKIRKYSFGLEHFVRELSQLHEIPDITTIDYAGAAAEMLLSGHHIELLDGDSSYIPIKWFNDVYRKLEDKITDAKIFVISVLGIQSSGKSTMLNTMFGLEFPVSAGRCTRGAFASLIPVSDSLKSADSVCDYILIIDTEGLRGSGDPQLRKHDTELATFVIGVANLTLINIFGENHNRMKEFLEIAITGLIKTYLLNEKKACKIVHQNVGAIDAGEKLTIVRSKLMEDLNEMTKLAATHENCEDKFQKINDIISINENEDVFYLPSFYQGNPPMAPINPEYGRAVQRIKTSVVTSMGSKEIFKYSISQFRERVGNLWQAILEEQLFEDYKRESDEVEKDDQSSDETANTQDKSSSPETVRAKLRAGLNLETNSKITPERTETVDKNTLTNEKLTDYHVHESDQSQEALTASTTGKNINTEDTKISSSRNSLSKLLSDFNLKPNSKFTLQQARTVDNHTLTDDQLTSAGQIPDYIFKRLMIADYHAREFIVKPITLAKYILKDIYDSDEDEDEYESINPMDALLGIFHCSDVSLRRYLALKLSSCQLSIPFILPDPEAPSEKITILLSALESITKSWKDENTSAQQVFATEHPFPVVSFIRIGNLTMSKSSLINKIMSDFNSHHNFFFNKDNRGGDVERKIVDGLVELSWYLPGGNKKQTLQNEICFANLRGDAKDFKKQLHLLFNISSVLCILLPSTYPDETRKKILEDGTQNKANVILIFNEIPQADAKKYFRDFMSKQNKKFTSTMRARQYNEHEFVEKVRENIQMNIKEVTAKPLVELASCASEYGIQLDEDQPHSDFEKNVDRWLEQGIVEAKDLLKLQLHIPALADMEREIYRPKRHREIFSNDSVYERIEAEKDAQKECFKQLDKRILYCLNSIAIMNETERNNALNKLKHQLQRMSLQFMAGLHKQDQKRNFGTPQKSEGKRLELLQQIGCSFGLEHIMRELAQLYQLDENKYDYAGAAAEMLLSGQPLELLDGDSFYIPLEWFNAVYRKLEHKTKNAKIFVISAVGIKNSGKSTMLNTMFGLELPVSAGRCTRGAFASLIPVSDFLRSASKCDYVLILDTEGLSGSNDPEKRKHDNKLAIFAIGVADATIVNIFGENYNVMKEFLQMAVHAFLKMKLNKEKKACKIVHQNVAAIDAKHKLAADRARLKKYLDEMTQLAAIKENCDDKVKELKDIILFDENEDVFYVPNLLKGNPPMAPVNPEYGEAVQRIKESVISLMCSKGTLKLCVSDFRERVNNLWTAMRQENFIFSVRNALEIRARQKLERKYFEVSVTVMGAGMAELQAKIKVALKRCSTREEREEKWAECKKQIDEEAEKLGKQMEEAMNDFFETNEDKATLVQWRGNIMNKIADNKKTQVSELRTKYSSIFEHLQNLHDVDERKKNYKEEILVKAKKLILLADGTKDAEELHNEFEKKWLNWIADVPECQEKRKDVYSEMVKVLLDTDQFLNNEMMNKLRERDNKLFIYKRSEIGINFNDLLCDKYHKDQQCISMAYAIKKSVVKEALGLVRSKSKSSESFTSNDLTQLYHKVLTTIEKRTENRFFAFGKALKCDILLHTFAQAYEIFEDMENRYIQERDIRGQLEKNWKPELKTYFENALKQRKKELLAATSFVDVLQKQIESALNQKMGSAVAAEVLKESKYQSKGSFHASVLIQLGDEGEFNSYINYLINPVGFLRTKLEKSIEDYCLSEKPNESIKIILEGELEKIETCVFAAISTANKETEDGSKEVTFWILRFVEECSMLAIKQETFSVAAIEDLEDVQQFKTVVHEKVTQLFKDLKIREVHVATIRKWDPSPHDCLFKEMFACQCTCPFCEALCEQTIPNHERHSTPLHRPSGVIGHKHETLKMLSTRFCSQDVASRKVFKNADTDWNRHRYRDYQSVNKYYNSWDIPSDSSYEAPKYWQRFMATFSRELAAYHIALKPDIPRAWKRLRFKTVKDELRQKYNLQEKP